MSLNVILATTKTGGIGVNGRMAWKCPEELQLFASITDGQVLVMGRKTVQSLPKLNNRIIICVSKTLKTAPLTYKNRVHIVNSVEEAVLYWSLHYSTKDIFIAGGAQIYNHVFKNMSNRIHRVYYSQIKKEYLCDSFVADLSDILRTNFVLLSQTDCNEFIHSVFKYGKSPEEQYLTLLKDVLNTGVNRESRNGLTKAVFARHLKFDLREGFPLLTTKKMFWKGIVEELLFFLRGDTDTKKLEEKGIHIWSGNTSREFLDQTGKNGLNEGDMGPMYGYQWRKYGARYGSDEKGKDQLVELINQIRNDAHSRRLLMTDYNPLQANEGVLFPCHSLILQFFVDGEFLDMFCYNRSSDLFLGLPFNIASSSLLQHIIANITELTPRFCHISLGDCHIYKEHFDVVNEQLSRCCFVFSSLHIRPSLFDVQDIENLTMEDFTLTDYHCHPAIKAKMIA